MYDLHIASLTKKLIRGHAYYYLRECQRVGGKPKIVFQRYLGTVDEVLKRLRSADFGMMPRSPLPPREADVAFFGAEAALYDLAMELDVVGRIDRRLPKREHGAPSVGTYLLLAALQRAIAPGSKAALADWHCQSVLRRLLPGRSAQLSSQRFWNAMDRIRQDDLIAIESELATEVVRDFGLDVRSLLFDCTNFFSFIDSFNDRPTLPQRGHSKEGRASLRIIGMALLCTADFDIPLFHHLYPGNQTDAPTFQKILGNLVARCLAISPTLADITLVFDKGNNSHENLKAVSDAQLHFVGSLVPTQHPDLLSILRSQLTPVVGFPTVSALRLKKTVYGAERTVLVTFNQELYDAQVQTLEREVHKRIQKLYALEQSLERWHGVSRGGRRPTIEATRRAVARILNGRHMKELVHVDVTTDDTKLPRLAYRQNYDGFATLQRMLLGKTLLFTDRDDWSVAQIVSAYRSQHHVESDFRRLKDPYHLAFRPAYHWTDQKLRVHAFTCVLALLLCNLLRKKVAAVGLPLSTHRLLDELGGIREITNLYDKAPGARTPMVTRTLSHLNATQQRLYEVLNLERYRAK